MANSMDQDQTAPIGAVCSGSTLFASILNLSVMLGNYLQQTISAAGFALPIAIVAKCEEIINLAQKIVIWRQLLAKEKSLAKFFVWRRNVTSGLSHCLVPLYANCQLTPRLTPNNSVPDQSNLDTRCF